MNDKELNNIIDKRKKDISELKKTIKNMNYSSEKFMLIGFVYAMELGLNDLKRVNVTKNYQV